MNTMFLDFFPSLFSFFLPINALFRVESLLLNPFNFNTSNPPVAKPPLTQVGFRVLIVMLVVFPVWWRFGHYRPQHTIMP